jgi:hypothetical protein
MSQLISSGPGLPSAHRSPECASPSPAATPKAWLAPTRSSSPAQFRPFSQCAPGGEKAVVDSRRFDRAAALDFAGRHAPESNSRRQREPRVSAVPDAAIPQVYKESIEID